MKLIPRHTDTNRFAHGSENTGLGTVFFRQATRRFWILLAGLTLLAFHADAQIRLTSVPAFGDTNAALQGTESGFAPSDYSVAVLTFVEGLGWYSKPYCDSNNISAEVVPLNADGTWSTSIVTGGVDQTATRIAVFLVPSGASISCTRAAGGLPPALLANSVSHVIVHRTDPNEPIIDFSGWKWHTKANSMKLNPGPCLYSNDPANVFVDGFGFLHLRSSNASGSWTCAEVYSQRVFHYGRYTFNIGSDISTLDPNLDFGMFTWNDADDNYSNREVDIEASRFANPGDTTNAQFVIQPYNQPGHLTRITIPAGTSSIYSFEWRPGSVGFSAYDSYGQPVAQLLNTLGVPPSGTTNARLNLWTYHGVNPSADAEVIVQGFTFTPFYPDFDGDGRYDYSVWRPGNGVWYTVPTSNPEAPVSQQWGLTGDLPVVADFDNDGKLDQVVWRPGEGNWYILQSSDSQVRIQQWGLSGDIPVPGDYDGDGQTDFAVWRPSDGSWYVLTTGAQPQQIAQQWGLPGDVPVPGDYDGDGIQDFAVWRPSTGEWYVIPSTNPSQPIVQQWGLAGDVPVPGDYDADGITDFAVWRPSTGVWYVIPSASPSQPITKQWGLPEDLPVPNDYDNDLRTDFAVWRPSTGTWYVVPSSSSDFTRFEQWGLPSDIPLYSPVGLIPSLANPE